MTPEDGQKRNVDDIDTRNLNGVLVHIEKVPNGDSVSSYVLRLNNGTVIRLPQFDALMNLRVNDSFEFNPDIVERKPEEHSGRTIISIAKSNKPWLTFIVPNACIHPPEKS